MSTTEYHKLDTPTQVLFYEQDFYVLSNFSAFNVEIWGAKFQTSEHAYQWMKFAGLDSKVATKIFNAPSAHAAFKLAEENKHLRRSDWDMIKVAIMLEILRAKVEQHEYVRRKLLDTGDRELIEDSWRDAFWGWGPTHDGENMLGKLWMRIRGEIKASAEKDRKADKTTFTVECTMKSRWVPHFLSMLKYMQQLGSLGCSRMVAFYADGDGDFRPKFKFDPKLPCDAKPIQDVDGDRTYDAG